MAIGWKAAIGVLVLLATACGSSSPSASTPAATSTPAGELVVLTSTTTVAGTSQVILTDTSAKTLYYLTSDSAQTPKCVSACVNNWPPLMASGSVRGAGITGSLTVVTNPNGSQVAYNGHLLYRFAKDAAPGDAKGEGINAFGGTWHVATPDLATA